MARAKTDDSEPILLLSDDGSPGEDAIEDQIRAEFNQASDAVQWRIKVSRFVAHGKQESECFECTPSDFPITDRLREDHGGGMYRVRVWKDGKLFKFFQYNIEAAKRPPVDALVKTELGTLSQTFQAAFDRQTQMIERLLDKLSNRGNDGGGKQPTITELMAAMVSMKEFIAPKERGNSPSELIQIFKLGIEAGGGAPVAEGTGILGSLERILSSPIIQKIAEGAMTAMPAPAVPGTPTAAHVAAVPRVEGRPNGGAVRVEPTATTPSQEQQIQVFMRTQVLYLLGRAHQWKTSQQSKSHPDLYAEWVVDNIPIEILRPLVEAPNALELLAQFVPEVAGFADWFAQLLESVRAELTGAAEEGDNGEPLANGSNGTRPNVSSATESGAGVVTGRP